MSPLIHTLLVILCIYLPYKYGVYVGGMAGYDYGFNNGCNAGISAVLRDLHENHGLTIDADVTITDNDGEDK